MNNGTKHTTDFIIAVSQTDEAMQLAASEVRKYDGYSLTAKAQIGRELAVENSNLRKGIQVMSDVMRDLEYEIENGKIKLQATKSKLGKKLSNDEIEQFRRERQITLSTSEMLNRRLLDKCNTKLQ